MKAISLFLPIIVATSCANTSYTGSVPQADLAQDCIDLQEDGGPANSHMTGAYTDQREPSDEEMAIFRKVTGEGDMVFTPLSVSSQVVAGLNYKFWCRYEDETHGTYGHCWVVIYRDLQGNVTLTSINPL